MNDNDEKTPFHIWGDSSYAPKTQLKTSLERDFPQNLTKKKKKKRCAAPPLG